MDTASIRTTTPEVTTDDFTPPGLCQCGCGQRTRIAATTNTRDGQVKGEPLRYVHNHHARKSFFPHTVEDRGHDTPCHLWNGSIAYDGYGRLRIGGREIRAHRHLYIRAQGPIPDGFHVHHLCGVRRCVRLTHLEAVSPLEHARIHPSAGLTLEIVREMRARIVGGEMTRSEAASHYGVSRPLMTAIMDGTCWPDTDYVPRPRPRQTVKENG